MMENTTQTDTLKDDKGMPAWALPILSALGSMGGSYMLWVKPLQESFRVMSEQVEDLRSEIKELKHKQRYEKEMLDDEEEDDDELLPTKKTRSSKKIKQKQGRIFLR